MDELAIVNQILKIWGNIRIVLNSEDITAIATFKM